MPRARILARELGTAGHAVRGTTRDPSRRPEIEATGAQAFVADPDRVGSLIPALDGVTSCASSSAPPPDPQTTSSPPHHPPRDAPPANHRHHHPRRHLRSHRSHRPNTLTTGAELVQQKCNQTESHTRSSTPPRTIGLKPRPEQSPYSPVSERGRRRPRGRSPANESRWRAGVGTRARAIARPTPARAHPTSPGAGGSRRPPTHAHPPNSRRASSRVRSGSPRARRRALVASSSSSSSWSATYRARRRFCSLTSSITWSSRSSSVTSRLAAPAPARVVCFEHLSEVLGFERLPRLGDLARGLPVELLEPARPENFPARAIQITNAASPARMMTTNGSTDEQVYRRAWALISAITATWTGCCVFRAVKSATAAEGIHDRRRRYIAKHNPRKGGRRALTLCCARISRRRAWSRGNAGISRRRSTSTITA
jgi:hypothetical protein